MNFDKYQYKPKEQPVITGEMKEAAPVTVAPDGWQDSAPVVRLSEYLKMNRDHGIHLILSDGHPALAFEPGLTKVKTDKDRKRWQIATNCIELLFDAASDLKQLIASGSITLPESVTGPPGTLKA